MTTNDPHLNLTRRQRARARYGGRHFASTSNLAKEASASEVMAIATRPPVVTTDGSLSPHEVLESPKTPWIYLVHLAIAAKARGIAFQLDGTRFYVVCSAIDWRFIEGEAVMS